MPFARNLRIFELKPSPDNRSGIVALDGARSLIAIVAGARPNFMKIAPIVRALEAFSHRFVYRIVHTGQHYDAEMNKVFFQELEIPDPAAFLGAGSGSHG